MSLTDEQRDRRINELLRALPPNLKEVRELHELSQERVESRASTTDVDALIKSAMVPGAFDCVVDKAGGGDYTELSAALNAGHTKIFVQPGTYVLSNEVIHPNNIAMYFDPDTKLHIVGADRDTTIIELDCNQNAAMFDFSNEINATLVHNLWGFNNTDKNNGRFYTNNTPLAYFAADDEFYFVSAAYQERPRYAAPGFFKIYNPTLNEIHMEGAIPFARFVDTGVQVQDLGKAVKRWPGDQKGFLWANLTVNDATTTASTGSVFREEYCRFDYFIMKNVNWYATANTYPFYEPAHCPIDTYLFEDCVFDPRLRQHPSPTRDVLTLYMPGTFRRCKFLAGGHSVGQGRLSFEVGNFTHLIDCVLLNVSDSTGGVLTPNNQDNGGFPRYRRQMSDGYLGRFINNEFINCKGTRTPDDYCWRGFYLSGNSGMVHIGNTTEEDIFDHESFNTERGGTRTQLVTAAGQTNIGQDVGIVLVDTATAAAPVTIGLNAIYGPRAREVMIIDVGNLAGTHNITVRTLNANCKFFDNGADAITGSSNGCVIALKGYEDLLSTTTLITHFATVGKSGTWA